MWQESRALLRPQFHKQRIADLVTFEHQISQMISLLPKDGRTFELSDYWYRFTLDASTEYLFGQSIGSLLNPKVSYVESSADIRWLLLRHLPIFNISSFLDFGSLTYGGFTLHPSFKLPLPLSMRSLSRLLRGPLPREKEIRQKMTQNLRISQRLWQNLRQTKRSYVTN